MKLGNAVVLLILLVMSSCSKKETTYIWQGDGESRTLTLTKDGAFKLEINAGYYTREDTGSYKLLGDTLIINPNKAPSGD